jgi:hypothetical protein
MQTRFIAIQSARIFTGASAVAQVYPSPLKCNATRSWIAVGASARFSDTMNCEAACHAEQKRPDRIAHYLK